MVRWDGETGCAGASWARGRHGGAGETRGELLGLGGLATAPVLSEAEGEDVAVEGVPLVRRRGRRGGHSGGERGWGGRRGFLLRPLLALALFVPVFLIVCETPTKWRHGLMN